MSFENPFAEPVEPTPAEVPAEVPENKTETEGKTKSIDRLAEYDKLRADDKNTEGWKTEIIDVVNSYNVKTGAAEVLMSPNTFCPSGNPDNKVRNYRLLKWFDKKGQERNITNTAFRSPKIDITNEQASISMMENGETSDNLTEVDPSEAETVIINKADVPKDISEDETVILEKPDTESPPVEAVAEQPSEQSPIENSNIEKETEEQSWERLEADNKETNENWKRAEVIVIDPGGQERGRARVLISPNTFKIPGYPGQRNYRLEELVDFEGNKQRTDVEKSLTAIQRDDGRFVITVGE
ncbi:MAG: hypothetical protein WCS89_00480 [Candidatus Paceibacterota bacterium]